MSSALLQAQALVNVVNADCLDDAETILRDHLKGLPNSPVALQGLDLVELKRGRLQPARTLVGALYVFSPGMGYSTIILGSYCRSSASMKRRWRRYENIWARCSRPWAGAVRISVEGGLLSINSSREAVLLLGLRMEGERCVCR